jgi:succinate dehydrogenase / fumarate reductase iron-sulfur subunit
MSSTNRTFNLRVWRQNGDSDKGHFENYEAKDITPDMSFLEMLDVVNEGLIHQGKEPITFESDCREGICGSCGFMVNGLAHGPDPGATICQVHMRHFADGAQIVMEPFRAKAFPIVKDLMVDRSSFDRIVSAGGYVSVKTGAASEANIVPIPHDDAEEAFDFAACIGCGACVAQCKNASAALFTGAKITHLTLTPQGRVERAERALAMTIKADDEGFGSCSNEGECEAVCPKEISIKGIAFMNKEVGRALLQR